MNFRITIIQIASLIRKEFLAVFKEPAGRAILIVPVFLQALLYGYGAIHDISHVPYALLDQSRSAASRELIARIDGTGIFVRTATLTSSQQIAEQIDAGKVLFVINFPTDFERQINAGETSSIQLILDGRNSTTAGAAAGHISSIVAYYNASLGEGATGISLERRAWFNPNLESRHNMMPGLIAVLSMLQTLLLAALSVAREREQGTFEQLLVTPLTPIQILIGKALPPILIGLLQSTIILVIIRFWFRIPMQGSIGLLYFGVMTFTVAIVGMGLSISALSQNMQQAMLYTFLSIMPALLLSGFFTPIRNMPEVLQIATYANPLRFGINIVRRIYLENASFYDIGLDFIPLAVLAAITLPSAAWLFRNRLS